MASRPTASTHPAPGWRGSAGVRLALALVVLVAGAAFGLSALWPSLHAQWSGSYTYNHGYLVLALALWMAWRHWRQRPPRELRPDWLALPVLAALVALLGLLELLFVNVPRLLLLPLLFVACVWLVLGRDAARRLFWPAVFVYFALPIWNVLNAVLQSVTTLVVTRMVAISDVPAFIEGNFVHIPAGTFEIAEGCSGLHYFIVGLALSAFYGLMYLATWPRRALLFVLTAAVAALINWIRVYLVILAGHLTDMQHYLVTVEHYNFGWLLFAIGLVPVLLLARRMEPAPGAGDDTPAAAQGFVASGRVLPAAAVAAVALLVPRLLAGTPSPDALSAAELGGPPLAAIADAQGIDPAWQPRFVNAHEERAVLRSESQRVELYRAVYPHQDRDHRLVRYEQTFTGRGWRPVGSRQRTVPVNGAVLQVIEYEGYLQERPHLVWAWYEVAGEPAVSGVGAKLAELGGLLRGRRDAQAIALATDCGADCTAARSRLGDVLLHIGGGLHWQPGLTTDNESRQWQ